MTSSSPPRGWSRPGRGATFVALQRLPARAAHLVVEHPELGPLICQLGQRGRWTIGRAPWCDLVIDWDPAVSRTHAVVEAFGLLLTLEPAGQTTNALRIDEHQIRERAPLRDGSTVTLGSTQLLVRLPVDAVLEETLRVDEELTRTPPALSRAERRLAEALAAAPQATNRALAEQLGLAHETIRSQMRALLGKARVLTGDPELDRTTLVARLVAAELISAPDAGAPGAPHERAESTGDDCPPYQPSTS